MAVPLRAGTCVVSVWEDGTEFHTDDPVAAHVDWRVVEDACRTAIEMYGRDHEACGLFTSQEAGQVTTSVLQNASRKPGEFALYNDDSRLVYWLRDMGMLQGIWHSHPNGSRRPSSSDWAGHPTGVPMYIVSMESPNDLLVMRFDDSDRPGWIDPEGDSPGG